MALDGAVCNQTLTGIDLLCGMDLQPVVAFVHVLPPRVEQPDNLDEFHCATAILRHRRWTQFVFERISADVSRQSKVWNHHWSLSAVPRHRLSFR